MSRISHAHRAARTPLFAYSHTYRAARIHNTAQSRSAIAFSPEVLSALDAIVDAWQPGIGGSAAIASAIFGDFSPAGRTPVTWYKATDQLPPMTDMSFYPAPPSAVLPQGSNGLTYRHFNNNTPAGVHYPFGYGLSYTTFTYGALAVNGSVFGPCDSVGLAVAVTNAGAMDSDEVVQVYVSQPDASVPAPRIRLAAFARVHIRAGQTVTVPLAIQPDSHTVILDGDVAAADIYTASSSEVRQFVRAVVLPCCRAAVLSYMRAAVPPCCPC